MGRGVELEALKERSVAGAVQKGEKGALDFSLGVRTTTKRRLVSGLFRFGGSPGGFFTSRGFGALFGLLCSFGLFCGIGGGDPTLGGPDDHLVCVGYDFNAFGKLEIANVD